jgi:hypothetical protein
MNVKTVDILAVTPLVVYSRTDVAQMGTVQGAGVPFAKNRHRSLQEIIQGKAKPSHKNLGIELTIFLILITN